MIIISFMKIKKSVRNNVSDKSNILLNSVVSKQLSCLFKSVKYSKEVLDDFQDCVTAKLTLVNSEIIVLNKLERVWTLESTEVIVNNHKKTHGLPT